LQGCCCNTANIASQHKKKHKERKYFSHGTSPISADYIRRIRIFRNILFAIRLEPSPKITLYSCDYVWIIQLFPNDRGSEHPEKNYPQKSKKTPVPGVPSVGAGGVEPPTSASRTQRSNRTEPRPEQASRDYTCPPLFWQAPSWMNGFIGCDQYLLHKI
jgi:hypothetical protein